MRLRSLLLFLLFVIAAPGLARAQTLDYSNGFFFNTGLTGSHNVSRVGNVVKLTGGSVAQSGAFYTSSKVNVTSFRNHFQFQLLPSMHGSDSVLADGITFTIQNNSPTAWGGGGGGNLLTATMPNSVTIKFDCYNNIGEGFSSTGMYLNGAPPMLPAIDLLPSGIDLQSYHLFDVTMDYNGSVLTVKILDTKTLATATQTYNVDIPAVVGGTSAYVGFTGSNGGLAAMQTILCWDWNLTATRIVRVSETGNDANDGSSWANAVRTVQRGINLAAAGGFSPEVWVAKGTYNEKLVVPPAVSLYGGFSGSETLKSQRNWVANVTTIRGNQVGLTIITQGGGRPNRVDGFTVTNGQRGIGTDGSTPYIANCTITGNAFGGWGTGIGGDNSGLVAVGNEFIGNTSIWYGGGISVGGWSSNSLAYPYVTQNRFIGNSVIRAFDGNGGYGGGLYLWNCRDVAVAGNEFRNNSAAAGSGGAHINCENAGGATVAGNLFEGNTSSDGWSGGADLFRLTYSLLKRNQFLSNQCVRWTGGFTCYQSPSVRIMNNVLEENVGEYTGGCITADATDFAALFNLFHLNRSNVSGGMEIGNMSSGTILNNTFWDNSGGWGGGLRLNNCTVNVHNNHFAGNQASALGGAIEMYEGASFIANNQFYGNHAGSGGAMSCWESRPRFSNNTLVYNSAGTNGSIHLFNSAPEIASNIIAFAAQNAIGGTGSKAGLLPNIHHNLFFGNVGTNVSGYAAGAANSVADPLFVNAGLGDLRLMSWSPAIDAGDTSLAVGVSFGGQPRVVNGVVDIGAIEFQGARDQAPPVTTLTADPAPNAAGWNNSPVTITLTATDSTGIAKLSYRLNGGAWIEKTTASTSFTVSDDGNTTIEYFATDGFLSEEKKTHDLKLDQVLPGVSFGTPSPAPNGAGWNTGDVTIPWMKSDDRSGVVGATSGELTITGEGAGLTGQVTVTDVAGNSKTASSPEVYIDRTKPTTTAGSQGSTSPNGTALALPASIVLTPNDAVSGVAATYWRKLGVTGSTFQLYSGPIPLSSEGVHTLEWYSVDVAGNVEAAKNGQWTVDNGPPTLTFGSVITQPNAAGWYRTPVEINWSAVDMVSAIVEPAPSTPRGVTKNGVLTVTAEGAAATGVQTLKDAAGWVGSYTSPAFRIDLTAPVTSYSLASGKYTLSAADNLSGVAATYYSINGATPVLYSTPFPVNANGTNTVQYWSVDVAGNLEVAKQFIVANGAPKLDLEILSVEGITENGRRFATIYYQIRNRGAVAATNVKYLQALNGVYWGLPSYITIQVIGVNDAGGAGVGFDVTSLKPGKKYEFVVEGTYNDGVEFYLSKKVEIP